MTKCDINITIRGQCCGHMKGVRRLLTCLGSQAGASSATSNNTSSVLGSSSTPAQLAPISDLTHQQVTGLVQSYHEYMQAYMSQHVFDFQLHPLSSTPPIVPPPQGLAQEQPDADNTDGDDYGPTELGAS